MILDQEGWDNAIQDLLKKLSEIYIFINEDGRLAEIQIMQELYGNMARQVLECADFIVHYSETKSTCKSSALCRRHLALNVSFCTGNRLSRDVFKETGSVIRKYNDVLDTLMQQCRDRRNIVNIRRVGKSWLRFILKLC